MLLTLVRTSCFISKYHRNLAFVSVGFRLCRTQYCGVTESESDSSTSADITHDRCILLLSVVCVSSFGGKPISSLRPVHVVSEHLC